MIHTDGRPTIAMRGSLPGERTCPVCPSPVVCMTEGCKGDCKPGFSTDRKREAFRRLLERRRPTPDIPREKVV